MAGIISNVTDALAGAGDFLNDAVKTVTNPNIDKLLHSEATKFDKFNDGAGNKLQFPDVLGTEEMPHIIAFHIKDKVNTSGPVDTTYATEADKKEVAAYQADYGGLKNELMDAAGGSAAALGGGFALKQITNATMNPKHATTAKKLINWGTGIGVGASVLTNAKDLADSRGAANKNSGRMFRFKAPSVRTQYSIFLPMPTKVDSDYSLTYQDQSTQNAASGVLRGVMSLDSGTASVRGITALGESLFESISARFGGAELLNAYVGRAANPLNELLFKNVNRREFTFKFSLRPQSQKEAQSIYNIVKRFKMAAMPEFDYSKKSCYWINPNEFDIEFLRSTGNGNIENAYLHKIGTCACTKFNVTYGNNTGPWTVYDGYGGKYWAPVLTEISISFSELDILNKQRIQEGR